MNQKLKDRSQNLCELCGTETPSHEYTVSPKSDDTIEHQVAICDVCLNAMNDENSAFHWRCLEGSIWNPEPSVQALSYRLLHQYKNENWANDLISSVDIDENIKSGP